MTANGNLRKSFLITVVSGFFMVAVGFSFVPFVGSWAPSARAINAFSLILNLDSIEPGALKKIEFQNTLFAVFRPNERQFQQLMELNERANGADYSLENKPELFLYLPISTSYGCLLQEFHSQGDNDFFDIDGWFDPCHAGFWDFSGRLIPDLHGGGVENLEDLYKVDEFFQVTFLTTGLTTDKTNSVEIKKL